MAVRQELGPGLGQGDSFFKRRVTRGEFLELLGRGGVVLSGLFIPDTLISSRRSSERKDVAEVEYIVTDDKSLAGTPVATRELEGESLSVTVTPQAEAAYSDQGENKTVDENKCIKGVAYMSLIISGLYLLNKRINWFGDWFSGIGSQSQKK